MPLSSLSLIQDYLNYIDFTTVLVSVVNIFEPAFALKEDKFPSKEWPSQEIVMTKQKMWGNQFQQAVDDHHKTCENLMQDFIEQHYHLFAKIFE